MTDKLQFTVEDEDGEEITYTVPSKYEVCDGCSGKGSHVNPAIDGHGISGEEWAEWDDDERDAYRDGRYDVVCEDCNGKRVQLVPNFEVTWAPGLQELWESYWEGKAEDRRERDSERTYGY